MQYGVISYEILIDNRVDLVSPADSVDDVYSYNVSSKSMDVASPTPVYGTTLKQTIQNPSLKEFATMLFQ